MNFRKIYGIHDMMRSRCLWWWVVAVILLTVQNVTALRCLHSEFSPTSAPLLGVALANVTLLLVPFLLLRGRWRLLVWIPLVGVPMLLVTLVLISRNFGEGQVMSLGTLALASTVDGVVLRSAGGLLRPVDCVYPLCLVAEILLFCRWRREIYAACFTGWLSAGVFAGSLGLLLLSEAWNVATFRKFYSIDELSPSEAIRAYLYTHWQPDNPTAGFVRYFGIGPFMYTVGKDLMRPSVTLSPQERRETAASIAAGDGSLGHAIAANRGRNLIVIVVESLTTEAIETPDEWDVCPTLKSLVADSTTLYAPRIISKVGLGMSADGQFMYNTGLPYLSSESLVGHFAAADYPSLAKALKPERAVELICEDATLWNHRFTSRSYGYDTLTDNIGWDDEKINDSRIAGRAAMEAGRLAQPFLIFLSTADMHSPYRTWQEPGPMVDRDRIMGAGMTAEETRYLEATKAFDSALGEFIAALRKSGLYDSCVIAIVSDHAPPTAYISPRFGKSYIPLIVLNSGAGQRVEDERSQLDVFPTLLDVMGVESYRPVALRGAEYRGIGRSMLLPGAPAHPERVEAAQRAIRGHLFSEEK